jgi:hypothetical protein
MLANKLNEKVMKHLVPMKNEKKLKAIRHKVLNTAKKFKQ